MIAIGLLTTVCLLVMSLRRQLTLRLHSATTGFLVFYPLLAVVGFYAYGLLRDEKGVSAAIDLHPDELTAALNGLLALTLAGALGARAYLALSKGQRQLQSDEAAPSTKALVVVLLLAAIPWVLLVVGAGPEAVLSRGEYISTAVPLAKIAGGALAPCALLAMGFLSTVQSRRVRIAAGLVTALYIVILLSFATRLLALVPLLFVAGRSSARPLARRDIVAGMVAVPITVVLMHAALLLRSLPEQGVIPFLMEASRPESLATSLGEASAVRNVLFGFELTGLVMHEIPLTSADLAVSLTPLPSVFTDWELRSETLRVNVFTPYNTPGELLNHGVLIALLYYAIAGAILAKTDIAFSSAPWLVRLTAGLPLLALGWGFVIRSTQYNLRSSTRLLYYLVILHVVIALWRRRTRVAGALALATSVRGRPLVGRSAMPEISRDTDTQESSASLPSLFPSHPA